MQPPHADRPVYVSIALDCPVRAMSDSLSRVSDLISPIGATVRLARGDIVVVCPRGQHLPRAVPAPLQPALRRARWRWRRRASRAGGRDQDVLRHDGQQVEGHGPLLLPVQPQGVLHGAEHL